MTIRTRWPPSQSVCLALHYAKLVPPSPRLAPLSEVNTIKEFWYIWLFQGLDMERGRGTRGSLSQWRSISGFVILSLVGYFCPFSFLIPLFFVFSFSSYSRWEFPWFHCEIKAFYYHATTTTTTTAATAASTILLFHMSYPMSIRKKLWVQYHLQTSFFNVGVHHTRKWLHLHRKRKKNKKKKEKKKIKKKEEVKREANLESSLDLPVGFAGPKPLLSIPNLHG